MASLIKRGESLFIPFRDGHSISDSQLRPRMYKTVQAYEKSFPGHYLGNVGVELVEYAEVVKCKDCEHYSEDGCFCWRWGGVRCPDHYCGDGERKDNASV